VPSFWLLRHVSGFVYPDISDKLPKEAAKTTLTAKNTKTYSHLPLSLPVQFCGCCLPEEKNIS
jgi:hypothetical protein